MHGTLSRASSKRVRELTYTNVKDRLRGALVGGLSWGKGRGFSSQVGGLRIGEFGVGSGFERGSSSGRERGRSSGLESESSSGLESKTSSAFESYTSSAFESNTSSVFESYTSAFESNTSSVFETQSVLEFPKSPRHGHWAVTLGITKHAAEYSISFE